MAETTKPLYDGLFLLNTQQLEGELSAGLEAVREVLERAGGEIVALSKWDERRLAYDIAGQRRGLYILALVHLDGKQIARIERDTSLDERFLRMMLIRGEHLGEAEIARAKEEGRITVAESQLRDEDGVPEAPAGAGVGANENA